MKAHSAWHHLVLNRFGLFCCSNSTCCCWNRNKSELGVFAWALGQGFIEPHLSMLFWGQMGAGVGQLRAARGSLGVRGAVHTIALRHMAAWPEFTSLPGSFGRYWHFEPMSRAGNLGRPRQDVGVRHGNGGCIAREIFVRHRSTP